MIGAFKVKSILVSGAIFMGGALVPASTKKVASGWQPDFSSIGSSWVSW